MGIIFDINIEQTGGTIRLGTAHEKHVLPCCQAFVNGKGALLFHATYVCGAALSLARVTASSHLLVVSDTCRQGYYLGIFIQKLETTW